MTLSCHVPLNHGPARGEIPSGTWRGYKRHERLGEKPCEACRFAFLARQRERRAANPEKDRERVRKYMAANPDKRAAAVARWRKRHPELSRQRTREWQQRNADKVRERNRRRKALQRDASVVAFTDKELDQRMKYYGYKCWMCGGAFEHVDHVKPLAKGGAHVLSNLRPSCANCNLSKNDTWPLEKTA